MPKPLNDADHYKSAVIHYLHASFSFCEVLLPEQQEHNQQPSDWFRDFGKSMEQSWPNLGPRTENMQTNKYHTQA